ncbi:MAG: hypothetical protein PF501_20095 [Salinisphaera sp.]|jgi:sarcosine oxidase subunit gamma|nr:hypothetical protein [Salinisphaera sp.]
MSEPVMESPLIGRPHSIQGQPADGQSAAQSGVSLGERPFLGHFSLRGKADDEALMAACSRVFGIALPKTPNTWVEGEGVVIGWMGPTEWLVLVAAETRHEWLISLREALADQHAGVVDLSGGQTLITLAGEHARDVLAKGSTLDLHPREAQAGFCTRSTLAKSAIFLRVVEAGERFEIVVRRSFADYLWQWLVDASEEYGCEILPADATLALSASADNDFDEAVNAS